MKRIAALAALGLCVMLGAAPALARDTYVIDQASMLSATTVSSINERVAAFNTQTGKEIIVQTVPSLNGSSIQSAAGKVFSDLGINGVLIFIAKDDRKDLIVPDAAGARAGWFSPAIFAPMYQAMSAQFKNEDYDAGVSGAVDSVLAIYRSHMNSLGANGAGAPVRTNTTNSYANSPSNGGFHPNMFWLIVLLLVAFLVIRSILRAMSAPRPPVGYNGPQGSGPGYGPGYGGMGGGGSFFSGMLGGLGGAFLGNELFGNRGGGNVGGDPGGSWGGSGGGGGGNAAAPDAGGWSSDAGAADTSAGGGGGDWSGGGFGDSGGGGDFGGGGGGDSGGGW